MQCSYFNRYEEKIVTEGIKQGIEQNSIEIAKKLKTDQKYTNQEIAKITKLNTKTIQQL